jgi:hypothetical protein
MEYMSVDIHIIVPTSTRLYIAIDQVSENCLNYFNTNKLSKFFMFLI